LNRTFSSTPTTYTMSFWVKRAKLSGGTEQVIFGCRQGASFPATFSFGATDNILFTSGPTVTAISTTALFRDVSAWYHIVVAVTPSATSYLYVNGVQIGSWTASSNPYLFNSSYTNTIGRYGDANQNYFDGYLTEINFIDGQALTPSSFGETDPYTGRWKAKAYSGTYGTNGFYLKFADNSGTTETTLGKDSAGTNNWTPNNFAVGGAQPALYSSPNLYTNASDVITNGTPLSSGSTFSSVYVYLVTNGGGDVGSKVFTADGSGNIGTAWTWLHRIGGVWTSAGGYNNSEWDSFTWGSQAVATNYIMNNSAPLHMLVPSAGSPQQVSGTIATFNIRPRSGINDDSLVDSPTNYGTDTGLGGEVRGNYTTLNPLEAGGNGTFSNGNLDVVAANSTGNPPKSTIPFPSIGKWYWEATYTTTNNSQGLGIIASTSKSRDTNSFIYAPNGTKNVNGSSSSYGSSYTNGDIIGFSLDMDLGTLTCYKNNSSQGNIATGLTGEWNAMIAGGGGLTASASFNFGQRPFAYTAPSGFKALCTQNLPQPTIQKPSTAMDVVTYTGNGTGQTISSLGFSPDLCWTKGRSLAQSHNLFDTLRNGQRLRSDTTGAEAATTVTLGSNGFTLGTESESNNNGSTFVAWSWDAGSTNSTNTAGSTTSIVRANPQAGFSIVSYTGNGSAATIGHGLGATPKMIIAKTRSTTGDWIVGHASLDSSSPWGYYIFLSSTAARNSAGAINSWGNNTVVVPPTSTVFSAGNGANLNSNGITYIAYCFAEIEGYSKFGSYTGNNSADGPFIWCGFRPKYILIKNATSTGAPWLAYDSVRSSYNAQEAEIRPNTSEAENGFTLVGSLDFLSNGFKIREDNNTSWLNTSSATFIFAAFAESPFKYARAR
jgi:hypothetical protein